MTSTLLKVFNDFDTESLNRMNFHNHDLVQKLKNNEEIKKEEQIVIIDFKTWNMKTVLTQSLAGTWEHMQCQCYLFQTVADLHSYNVRVDAGL